MTSTPSFSQTAYGWYEDGSETASADAGVGVSTAIDRYLDGDQSLGLRIRLQITNAVSGASTDDFQLQYAKNGGAFANLTTATTDVKAFASANLTDQGATTNRLGAGTGSFVAGLVSEDGLADNKQVTASNYSEFLYTVQLVAANLADGDVITFRVLRNGSTITYSVTPQVTVHVPAAVLSNGTALSNHANTLVTHKGGSVYEIVKVSGAASAFDADAVSSSGQTGDFVLRLRQLRLIGSGIIAGVNADPTTDSTYTGIDRAWDYFGSWQIIENATFFGSALADATYSWIWRTSGTIGYGRGSTLATAQASPDRTVADSNTLFFDSSLNSVGDRFEALFYVPVASTTYNDSLTESVTAGSSVAQSITFPLALSESVTSGASLSSVATFASPLSESATMGASLATTGVFGSTLSEGVTTDAALAGGLLLAASVTESVTVGDTYSASMLFAPTLAESTTLTATTTAGLVIAASVAEGITAGDSIAYALTLNASINSAITLAASVTAPAGGGTGARVTVIFLA
jgi:hypothetical protein